jgi:hypothetical protein
VPLVGGLSLPCPALAQGVTPPPAATAARPPASAAEALDRAAAAYEFGDIRLMIDLARRVAEGALPGNDDQRAVALRLLGIGLYLDGRSDGAERAFVELLTLRPKTTLDPAVTRPEVVAFFKEVRRRNEPRKHLALVFLPPLGQFQNDTPVRGWILGGLELLSLGTAVTTRIVLGNWRSDTDGTCRGGMDTTSCDHLKLANMLAVGTLATTWVIGVIDGYVNLTRPSGEVATRHVQPSLVLLPGGAGLHLRF